MMLKRNLTAISIVTGLLCCNALLALPEGGDVVAGSATIQQPNSTTVTVNQSTDKAIINWNQFNVGTNELTQFYVPNTSSVTLNRVIGGVPSQILGTLKSNGQLWLINPNGVVFGTDSQVNVAGIVASTLNITNENFLKGNYQLEGDSSSTAKIINQGNIVASGNGIIALLAPQIENSGVLSANLGTIALGTGNRATLNIAGNQLLSFSVDQGIIGDFYDLNGQRVASLSNTGQIIANGGRVLVTAQNIDKVLNQSINTSGLVEANTEQVINGQIIFTAAGDTMVTSNAVISAQGNDAGETGGTIEITGNRVGITDQATITSEGAAGGGKILIGGDFHGANPDVPNANATYIGQNAVINASATQNGNGGDVVVWSNGNTQFYGNIFSQGGPEGGNGGNVETSGHNLDILGIVNTSAPLGLYGSWLLDPADLTISEGATTNVAGGGAVFEANGTPANLSVSQLVAALSNNATVTVQTQNDAFGGSGNLSLQSTLDYTGSLNSTLILSSYAGIIISAPITNSGTGTLNVTLNPGMGISNILNMTPSGTINIKGTVTINTSNLNNLGVNLGSITAGSLSVVSYGSIGQNSGTSLNIGSLGTLFLIQAPVGSNDLILTNTGNSFVGSILINNNVSDIFRNVSINAASGTLSLNQVNQTTNPFTSLTLAADAGSSITISQGSAYQVSGTSTFFAGNGGTVNLSNANNNLGTKTVIGNGTGANMGSVSITTGTSGINISQNAGTISNLSLTSGGAISEDSSGSNNLNVTGTTTLVNGNNKTITLNNTNNVFGTSSSTGQIIIGSTGATNGAVTLFTGPNTVNIDQKGTSIASLAITTKNGSITQPVGSDPLNILGATTLDMTNGNTGLINLNNSSNQFGGTVTIGNGSTNIGGVTLNASGALTIAQASTGTTIGALTASSSGTLNVGSNINGSSTLNLTGGSINLGSNSLTSGSDINLTQTGSGNAFVLGGNITPGGGLSITTNAGAIQINSAIQVLNGNLSLNSQNGSINDNGGVGSIKVASPFNASFDSGSFGSISLTNPNNDFYTISASGSSLSFRDANDIGIKGIQTPGSLTIVAGGTLQFVNGTIPIRLTGFSTQTITLSANQLDNQYTNGTPINLGTGPGSRWIIYLANLVGNNFGTGANALVSNNQAIWGTSYPTSISQSGSRYVFATVEQLVLAPLSTIFTQTKTYGDTVAFPTPTGSGGSANYQVTGFVNAATYGNVFTQDTVNNITVDPANLSYTSTGAPTSANASSTPYAITMTGTAVATNGYTVSYNASNAFGQLTVNQAPLTISAVSATKQYDAGTSSATAPSVVGLKNFDTVTNLSQSYTSANVMGTNGSTLQVNSGYVINDNNGGNNYIVTINTAMGTITAAPLTISAVGATKQYNASTASSQAVSVVGLKGSDTVTNLTESYTSANVLGTNASTLKVNSGYTINDNNNGNNYILTVNQTANGTITAAPLTLTASNATKQYDATTTSSAAVGVSGLQGSDSVSNLSESYASKNVLGTDNSTLNVNGGYVINDNNGGNNYLVNLVSSAGTITAAPLVLTAVSTTKQYDTNTTSNGVVNVNGLKGSDSVTGLSQSYTSANVMGTNGSTLQVNGGYTINDNNGGDNYVVALATANGTITPAPLTLTASSTTKQYDANTNSNGTVSVTGLLGSDTATNLSQSYASKNVLGTNGSTLQVNNSYTINDNNGGKNYFVTLDTATGTITAAPLTLSAVSATKQYDGGTSSNGVVNVSGLQGSDTISNLTESYTSKNVAGTNNSTLQVNTNYSINDTNDGNNYVVTFNSTNGTITAAPLTISAANGIKIYDATTSSTVTPTVIGLQGSDSISNLSESYTSPNVMGLNGSTLVLNSGYTINDGNNGNNYTLTVNPTTTGTITPAALTIIAYNQTMKQYSDMPQLDVSYVGLQGSDTSTAVTGLQVTTDATNTSPIGEYSIIPSGGVAQNYSITYVDGVLTIIEGLPPLTTEQAGEVNPALVAKTLNSTIKNNSTIPFPGNPNKKPPVFCIKDPSKADPEKQVCY